MTRRFAPDSQAITVRQKPHGVPVPDRILCGRIRARRSRQKPVRELPGILGFFIPTDWLLTSRSYLTPLSSSLESPSTKRRYLDLGMLVQTIQHRYQSVNSEPSQICIPNP